MGKESFLSLNKRRAVTTYVKLASGHTLSDIFFVYCNKKEPVNSVKIADGYYRSII